MLALQTYKTKKFRNSKANMHTIETTRDMGRRPWKVIVQSRVASLAFDHHFDNDSSNVRPPWLNNTRIQPDSL